MGRLLRTLVLATTVWLALAGIAVAAPHGFVGLNPGGLPDLRERVPVNVVLLGFAPGQVDEAAFMAALPQEYQPTVVSRTFYDTEETLGLRYTYDVRFIYPHAGYQDRFFGQLASLAEPAPLTEWQQAYNDQVGNLLDVTDNHFIDAPSVERWIAHNPPAGVDVARNTLVFVNWWGRDDFVHHVYTKIGEPDPDTGYDFGALRDTRKIVAWGGTAPDDEETGRGPFGSIARIWFFDPSAGPEAWAGSWNVDDPDLDGDDLPDYRIPPIWEYDAAGYRAPGELTGDLAKVTRYVAFNLLFTSSPIYPPYLTPDRLPRSINLDSNTYEALAGIDASADYIKSGLLLQEEGELVDDVPLSYDNEDSELDALTEACYESGVLALIGIDTESCHPEVGYPIAADLFVHHALNYDAFPDGGGDYEALAFNFAITDELPTPFLGFADDNWFDGTQSFIFNVLSPGIIEAGYGLTTTMIHEYGHHFGMSHPHDGYDWEEHAYYDPTGDRFFAWLGDESNSMMSYIDVNWDFSQFDRDNYDRHHAAGYMLVANRIAADVLAAPRAHRVKGLIHAADVLCGLARLNLSQHRYPATLQRAQQCYRTVLLAADLIRVPVERSEAGHTLYPVPVTTAAAAGRGAVDQDHALLAKRFAR